VEHEEKISELDRMILEKDEELKGVKEIHLEAEKHI